MIALASNHHSTMMTMEDKEKKGVDLLQYARTYG